jgi:hypothetical protein
MPEFGHGVVLPVGLNSRFVNEEFPSAPRKRCARPSLTLSSPLVTVKKQGASFDFQPVRSLPLNSEVHAAGF